MLGITLLASRVEAAPELASSALEWEAPEGCPDREDIQVMLDGMLDEVDEAERRPVAVRGRLDGDELEGYRLVLDLDGGHLGTRELEGGSCHELGEAAALVIAMAIDPRLLERMELADQMEASEPEEDAPQESPPRDPPSIAPPVAEPAPPVPEPAPPERLTRRPSRRPSLLARVQGGVGGGPLPGASGVMGVALGLGGRSWRVELGASYWTPRSTTSPLNTNVGARAQLWAVVMQGCGEPRRGSLSFPLCAGLLAGAVQAEGEGDLTGRQVGSRWVAAALEPGFCWWVRPRVGLGLRARGHAALYRPELRSEPSGPIFVGAPVGGSLRAGVELRLP